MARMARFLKSVMGYMVEEPVEIYMGWPPSMQQHLHAVCMSEEIPLFMQQKLVFGCGGWK